METMEIAIATFRDLSYVVINHPFYSFIGSWVVLIGLLKFYCRLTLGICDCDRDMTGKTILITGATAGVGKATAFDMARRNAHVIMACRNVDKAQKVAEEIKSLTGNEKIVVRHLDLSSFNSVRKCAENVLNTEDKLHILINNAGILFSDKPTTEDGYETVFQSNYLGHFLLTLLLLDLLRKSSPSRIINVSSSSHSHGKLDLHDIPGKNCKSTMDFYGRSKQAINLFTLELASKLANSGVTVNSLCPGLVKTDIANNSNNLMAYFITLGMNILGKSCDEGAHTTIYLAVHPDVEKTTGKYFVDCKEQKAHKSSLDKAMAKKLFEVSEEIVGLANQKK